jgi:hypothetical protein
MSTRIQADFKITAWEPIPYDKPEEGPELSRVEVKKVFEGEVEAESTVVLLMCQAADGSAGYVATERVVGRVGRRTGSFVLQHGGALVNGQPSEVFGYVVPGSGTGELRGLRGNCTWYHDEHEATFTLDYEIV